MPLSRTIATLLFQGKTTLPLVIDLLTKYKMLALLPSIMKALTKLNSFSGKENTIVIESPFALSEGSVQKIKRIVGNDIAEHSIVINKDVLAGFKATFRGVRYDGSAERIIKQLLAK